MLRFATGKYSNYVRFPEKEWQEEEEKKGLEDKNPQTTVLLMHCEKGRILLLQVKGTIIFPLFVQIFTLFSLSSALPPTVGMGTSCSCGGGFFAHLQNSSWEWVRFLPIVPPPQFLAGSSLHSYAWFISDNLSSKCRLLLVSFNWLCSVRVE